MHRTEGERNDVYETLFPAAGAVSGLNPAVHRLFSGGDAGPVIRPAIPRRPARPATLIPSDTFPMFSNDIDYSRGGNIPESEDYLNYSAQKGFRHTFTDMVYHDAELAAVRLAEAGIFEKTDTFAPDETMNVQTFVTALLQLARQGKGRRG